MQLLIVEDDALVVGSLRAQWPEASGNLVVARSVAEVAPFVEDDRLSVFSAIIIDVNLPDGSGLVLIEEIRARSDIPILIISGSGDGMARTHAIEQGADDYLMKPFSMRELRARVTRLLAVEAPDRPPPALETFCIGAVACDLQRRVLQLGPAETPLTGVEARILEYMHANRNAYCSKTDICRHAIFRDYDPRDKTIEVYFSRLRRKLRSLDAASAGRIRTIRGRGYYFEAD